MKPTHWKCANCRKMKKLGEEILRADLHSVCLDCQRKRDTAPGTSTGAAPQVVYVHRRFPRRHGTDNRD